MDETAAQRPRRDSAPFFELLDRDWLLAAALAFFAAVVVWFGRSVSDFFGGSSGLVLLPAFAGQTLDDATAECGRLHLQCTVLARQASDRFPKDVVINQEPESGSRVREGRAVSLVVSTGVLIFPMPDLRYEAVRTARLTLGRLRLRLAKSAIVTDDGVPANHIVAQDPPPLSSVHEGTEVSLTLSKGPPANVKLPSFVDLGIDAARERAAHFKVRLGQIVWTPFGPDGPPRGTVVRQAPGPGRSIDPFEAVSLQVSAGPSEYGYLLRQVHVGVAVPPRYDTARLRLELRDQTGRWNVYDGYAESGQKLDFTVNAVGTAELETYVNEELLDSAKFGVEPAGMPPGVKGGSK